MAMNDFNIGFLAGLDGTKSKAKLNQDIDAIKKFGPCPIHRATFIKNFV